MTAVSPVVETKNDAWRDPVYVWLIGRPEITKVQTIALQRKGLRTARL